MASTSRFGRFQFSVENAYTVQYRIPIFRQYRTIFLKLSAPALCPASRGIILALAQRPFPSIIKAICRRPAFSTRAEMVSFD